MTSLHSCTLGLTARSKEVDIEATSCSCPGVQAWKKEALEGRIEFLDLRVTLDGSLE